MLLHLITLTAMLLAAGSATDEQWAALSNTATSITGDVTFTPQGLTFQNGQRLGIAYVGIHAIDRPTVSTHGAHSFDVYRVTNRTNPALLNGNTICRNTPTYMSVLHASSGNDVFVDFYDGPNEPSSAWDDARSLCASYSYETK